MYVRLNLLHSCIFFSCFSLWTKLFLLTYLPFHSLSSFVLILLLKPPTGFFVYNFDPRISICLYIIFNSFLLLKDFQAWHISLNIIGIIVLESLITLKSCFCRYLTVVPGDSCSYSRYLIPHMPNYLLLCPGKFTLKNYFKFEAYNDGSSSRCLRILPICNHHNLSKRLQCPWTAQEMLTQTTNRDVSWFTSQSNLSNLQSWLTEKGLLFDPWILLQVLDRFLSLSSHKVFKTQVHVEKLANAFRAEVILTSIIWVPVFLLILAFTYYPFEIPILYTF